ncbi:membrane protein insertase YidC [Buchnera aphidicola]|nr:membrane protein insertase YidC [Buchnera aphidicola]AHG60343.1 Yidc [Buchnera aphidicola str. USDA (Myzus persicae)]AHG60921.1 Yidc [Buchnera aphidicola str. W106 (Myzus persicae)]AHG61493.1 Yidc [Buchnera aphidicola str. G002 (Myzus persicae)]AHG62066.1 Yidc [Buchnera aphidicola str. F009 (Myzus persicae)]WAI02969.1 MAG: membrane protein insertase YidC [Buchnera aphidicola (Myzus persicae)]
MEVQRNFFIFAFLFVSFLLWQAWQSQSFPRNKMNEKTEKIFHLTGTNKNKKQIFLKNNVVSLLVNMYGGDIEEANLLAYKETLYSSHPFKLLETTPDFIYQAQSGLIGKNGPDSSIYNTRPLYSSNKKFFELKEGQKELRVPIKWSDKNGVTYTKIFILKPDRYDIEVEYDICNLSKDRLEMNMFGQIKQTIKLPKNRDIYSGNFALQTFRGAAYSSTTNKYEKYKFDTISNNKNLNVITEKGWIAMLQQYFAVAWIPDNLGQNTIYTSSLDNGVVAIGYKSSSINILPNSRTLIKSKLWVGPEIQKEMKLVAPNLDLTVDYGWLWFLSQPLFKLLTIINSIINNWGFSIILITFIMKIITYPLTKSQYVSMSKIRALQPKIKEIKEAFSDNKQRISQEMIILYKKEKINPLGGFLPVFIQMPVFLSLYYMLIGSVELRHAPFVLWIKDLSSQDPFYVLPIIMGLTMFFIQKTSSNNISDPIQKKIMNFMPVIFTVFFLWFPSGLVLYYIVSNLVTIIQQKFIFSNFKSN